VAGIQADLDVARVHVGMEEAVAEHLGEEDGDAVARQLGDVHAGLAQALHLADGHAVHALHHHDLGMAEVPEHLGDQHQVQPRHVAAQLRGVGGLAHQVQLVVQVLVELGHHLARLQALAIGRQAFHPAGHHAHEAQVFFDDRQHAGAQHLDGHLALAPPRSRMTCEVHLGNGRTGHRLALEGHKDLAQRPANARSMVAMAMAANRNGGTRSCSRASSSAMSAGSRSRRVDSTWPNLTKIGPQALQRLAQALAPRRVAGCAL
jgi:hypothetical protein